MEGGERIGGKREVSENGGRINMCSGRKVRWFITVLAKP